MERVLEATYKNGVLIPLKPLNLPENQRVVITILSPATDEPEETLLAWQQVYAGLSEEDIAEVEQVALNRSRFMRPE
jgi:predicted DNA-binding antitoxin AbrB/MazE fold protein